MHKAPGAAPWIPQDPFVPLWLLFPCPSLQWFGVCPSLAVCPAMSVSCVCPPSSVGQSDCPGLFIWRGCRGFSGLWWRKGQGCSSPQIPGPPFPWIPARSAEAAAGTGELNPSVGLPRNPAGIGLLHISGDGVCVWQLVSSGKLGSHRRDSCVCLQRSIPCPAHSSAPAGHAFVNHSDHTLNKPSAPCSCCVSTSAMSAAPLLSCSRAVLLHRWLLSKICEISGSTRSGTHFLRQRLLSPFWWNKELSLLVYLLVNFFW